MQDQRQKQENQRQVEQPERREDFEITLPDGTDVSEIRIEVGQLNDINFGF